jgi:hypothetical protein
MRKHSNVPVPKEAPLRVPRHTITVTKEIIKKACQRNSRHCMIAETIKAQIPGATTVTVDLMTIRFSIPEKGLRYTYHTPHLAQDALARFDRGIEVKPITVKLKNGHATSMVKNCKQDGKITQKPLHKLGGKKMRVIPVSGGTGLETQIVGGKPPPLQKPKHGSNSSLRVFGVRNWTEGWQHVSELGS